MWDAATLRADAQAGLAVAVFAVPQAMAYAALAGLPPVQGLYCAIVMSIIAALWGSSAWVNSGPTNTASLLTASALAPFVAAGHSLTVLVWTFTLLAGLIRVGFGVLKLGWLVRFVPEPAFLGFVCAADILIALSQLNQFLGVPASQSPSTLGKLADTLARVPVADWQAIAIGAGVVLLLLVFDRFSRRLPVALGAIILATLAAPFLASLTGKSLAIVRDIAPIPFGFPPFEAHAPDFALIGPLLPGAFAVAVIGLIEAVSIGQSLALKKRSELNVNQEFLGQGLAQSAAAFFGGFPGSSSFSRSALIERCGGQTALANVFFGVFTAIILWVAPRALERIPLAALAGLLLFTGLKMLDVGAIKRVWRTSKSDFGVLALTFAVTFAGKIEWGFFAGVVAAMGVFLSRARRLQFFELVPEAGGNHFHEKPYAESEHEPCDVVGLALHGDLFFGLAHDLRAGLSQVVRLQKPRFVVIRFRRAASIDYSCWKAIFDFAEAFQQSGGTLILTGVHPDLRAVINDAEFQAVLPAERVIAPSETVWAAFEAGLRQVGQSLDENSALTPAWRDYFAR